MLILAIDTATKIGSVALYEDKTGIIGEINLYVKVNHSNVIMKAVDSLFDLSGYTIKDVDKIAVTTGPGSFTGIRIGVAIAKGLAYSLKKPIIGINELDVLAETVEEREGLIVPLIDARKERVYYSQYKYENRKLVRKEEYKDGELRDILEKLKGEKVVFIGDGAIVNQELIKEIMGEDNIVFSKVNSIPRAAMAAQMALHHEDDNIYTLEPFYLNKSQAEREKEEREKKNN
ncbi:tRNA (adenosine(37)-N6)-threonylcarbamoyltransferase complex dimerization subunit type 1 TsaB [Fusobacterium ulcerans]|uniref:tRNA (adenosine(37)-N6)-threonylcarbamoyltransferase complex dimerization subunit type 1 TsaB n=1 Tax=Fusobacterium ulcerans TaxID=861 RepID=UPI001D0B3BE4|nr:tRNA (adenosine(37)-N6)-threonylcarbamoyltransferase complex dimerization subunit type 1 TsaB [Fusobacterium ulcerans]MCB8565551.1 tRNA (adenosine(37)-N6)-threonylcarbamoyltransferase complex dimerization subunit type 1 TsaB [Fusobacterium ulcerans]MCB8649554.1 tRNA (adenosine(37)-N6)-threonylcarbamoyltransferase complex dimerization subunit type 1 TsaB [Fusobacterium ulcerans]